MTLTLQVNLDPEERTFLLRTISSYRELPFERHWDGALAILYLDSPLTRETLEHTLSVARDLTEVPSCEADAREAVSYLAKVLSLLDRCSSYTRTESHAHSP